MIKYLYLGRVGYGEGLRLQAEMAVLRLEGRVENVLLLLEHPPVLTLGRNAKRAHVLASDELLARRGVALQEINRGGDVTYHGPGQLVGYPIFDLRSLRGPNGGRMGPVDFVRGMEEALIRLCAEFGIKARRIEGLTGVWCPGTADAKTSEQAGGGGHERKIGAIGIHVARGITSHGFAFNVTTDLRDFELIVPCGIADHTVTSLEREVAAGVALPGLEAVAHRAARLFGAVFDEKVVQVESVETLRAATGAVAAPASGPVAAPVFPAEVERLRGVAERPVQA
jgi:lipoyl(octanoyl) transferase